MRDYTDRTLLLSVALALIFNVISLFSCFLNTSFNSVSFFHFSFCSIDSTLRAVSVKNEEVSVMYSSLSAILATHNIVETGTSDYRPRDAKEPGNEVPIFGIRHRRGKE